MPIRVSAPSSVASSARRWKWNWMAMAASWCRPSCASWSAWTRRRCWLASCIALNSGRRTPGKPNRPSSTWKMPCPSRPARWRSEGLPVTANETYAHQSVMREEVLHVLPLDAEGFYIDATFGRGGHSRALLERLGPNARLVGIDRDPEAIQAGQQLERAEARFRIVAGRFDCLADVVAQEGRPLKGVLMDLGVSSPQLDDARRGFSFLRDGPLDVRMDPTQGESAADWLARAAERQIADVLYRYGGEEKSRRIARAICTQRDDQPLPRTQQLGEPMEQAIEALELASQQAVDSLAPGGRLAVISFHSLDDRIVKQLIRDASGRAPRGRGGMPLGEEQPVTLTPIGKAMHAGEAEVKVDPRARSAVLRVAEKEAG